MYKLKVSRKALCESPQVASAQLIRSLPSSCPRLEEIGLAGCSGLAADDFAPLSALTGLKVNDNGTGIEMGNSSLDLEKFDVANFLLCAKSQ